MANPRAFSLTALLVACAARPPVPLGPTAVKACTGDIGLAFKTDGLEVGERRFELAVFHGPLTAPRRGDDAVVRVRFFRVIDDSSLVTRPDQELHLLGPERVAKPEPPRPVDPASGQAMPFNFYVEPVFDTPGTWGAEVVVTAPWQTTPAITTVTFPVAPASAAAPP